MPEREQEPTARAFWSGTISFGLVSVPVQLLAGHRARPTSLRQVAPDGTPLAREYFCPADGEVLTSDEIVRGYRIDDDQYVTVTDEELEGLEPERSRDIDLRRFVPRAEIDPVHFERAYYLAPAGESVKAYRLLADTMERAGRAGLATFVMRGREHLVAILAEGGILRAETLRFVEELRSAEEADLPPEGEADRKAVKALARAIDAQPLKSLPSEVLEDEEAALLRERVEAKRASGEGVVELAERTGGGEEEGEEPGDILAVLRRSLEATGAGDGQRKQNGGGKGQRKRNGSGRPSHVSGASDGGDLTKLTKGELYERAKELDVAGRSKMSKDELVDALRRAG